jgi:predicted PurR-regulated permease PerM
MCGCLCLFSYSGVQHLILYYVCTFLVSCCDVRLKTIFSSSLHPVFVGGSVLYLFWLLLFANSDVQHVLTTLESKTNDLLAQIQDYLSQWRDSLNVLWTSTIKPTRACWSIKSATFDLHLNILVNIFRFVLKSVICIYTATYISKLVVLTVSAGRRQTNGYELCPSSSRFIFILIWVGVSSIRRFMRTHW